MIFQKHHKNLYKKSKNQKKILITTLNVYLYFKPHFMSQIYFLFVNQINFMKT